jgi:hypothetical protein
MLKLVKFQARVTERFQLNKKENKMNYMIIIKRDKNHYCIGLNNLINEKRSNWLLGNIDYEE